MVAYVKSTMSEHKLDHEPPLQAAHWLTEEENAKFLIAKCKQLLMRLRINQDDADDITIDVVHRLLENNRRFMNPSHLIANAMIDTRQSAIKHIRRAAKLNLVKNPDEHADQSDTESTIASKEIIEQMYKAMEIMNPKYKEALVLRFGVELSSKDAANYLNISVANFDKRVERARRELAEILAITHIQR